MGWSVRTRTRTGDTITVLEQLQDRRFSFYLNRPCTASGSISADAGAAQDIGLRPGVDEAVVMREGIPQETVFVCTKVSPNVNGDEVRVGVEWSGIMSYLSDALVLGTATAYSGTMLPMTWIDTFQGRTGGSAYGITQGTTTGVAPTRSRLIEQDATLLDEIVGLSETSGGFDFNIDAAREYNEWHTQRGSDVGLVLEYGVNVSAFSYDESAEPGEIVSDVRVIGPPGSSVEVATSATAQAAYGRREASLPYLTEAENATVTSSQLLNYANAAVAQRATPLVIPSVELRKGVQSVPWGSYWLGDTVRFKASVGRFSTIDARYRIVGIHVDVDANDVETIQLDLNKVAA